MNKVKIEKNSDGTYNVTLPTGGQSTAVSAQEAVNRLKSAEQEFQNALNDIKSGEKSLKRFSRSASRTSSGLEAYGLMEQPKPVHNLCSVHGISCFHERNCD